MPRARRAKPPAAVGRDAEREAERAFHAEVGAAIRHSRTQRAWTQVQLAEAAKLTPNYVARLERGELGPSLWVARRIATSLGVGLDVLLSPHPAPPSLRRGGRDHARPVGRATVGRARDATARVSSRPSPRSRRG